MSDLVVNPEDRFSHDAAHITGDARYLVFVVTFFRFCQLKFVHIDHTMCDLVHGLKTVSCHNVCHDVNFFCQNSFPDAVGSFHRKCTVFT